LGEQRHIIATFSEMAPHYERLMNHELTLFWGYSYEEFVSEFLNDLNTNLSDTILDIATGTAFIPAYLRKTKKPFKRIFGLDITLGMLQKASRNLNQLTGRQDIPLICASAHNLPFKPGSIDRAICCLATHHMHADTLLKNIYYCLQPGGFAHIADAGGSSQWKKTAVRFCIKLMAFLYFLIHEDFSRAVAESDAIANIHTSLEWRKIAEDTGFINIEIIEMRSKKFWAPNPLILKIQKPLEKEDDTHI